MSNAIKLIIFDEYYKKDVGFLYYFPKTKEFNIEINKGVPEKSLDFIMSHFNKLKQYLIPHEWAFRWVQSRIIPSERQNIGEILRRNNMTEYDEFQMLIFHSGRSVQDNYCLLDLNRNLV